MKKQLFWAVGLACIAGMARANSYSNAVETAAVGPVSVTCANTRGWSFALSADAVPQSDGKGACAVVTVTLNAAEESIPPVFDVSFVTTGADVTHVWTTPFNADATRLWPELWGTTRYSSQLAYESPLAVAMNEADRSRVAMASSEAFEKVLFGLVADERTCHLHGRFRFFTENTSARKSYTVKIRLDSRDIFWGDAVRDATAWIVQAANLTPAAVPEAARDPLYSTWYAYMQDVRAQELEREAVRAARLGMKTMILDDGWQKLQSASFYSATGDWMPVKSRFPDMKKHVAKVHAAGLKYMLWLSVPYVGDESQAWKRFQGKFLKFHGNKSPGRVGVLDPRFPEVRAYLIETYERAVRDWDFDGLKLDFIDQFVLPPVDPAVKENYAGRDYKSLPQAVDRLMKDILAHLKAIKSDVLVEFRQHYMGPAICQYGNMIRAADCPADPQANRVRIANLRLTSGAAAVHADMLVWNADETPEGAARPILNALFGVIQYSMILQTLPPAHEDVIRHWLGFTSKHRDVLLKGAFRPHHPELNYPLVEAENAAKRLFAVYSDGQCVETGAPDRPVYLVNATSKAGVLATLPCKAQVKLFNTLGAACGSYVYPAGTLRLPVPESGYAEITWLADKDTLETMAFDTVTPQPIPRKAWRPFEGGCTFAADTEVVVARGTNALRRSGAIWGYTPAKGRETAPFVISAEGLSESLSGGEALIYVDVSYADGTALWGQKAYFPQGEKGTWHAAQVFVLPTRPVRHASVYLMVIGGEGTFRFRKSACSVYPATGTRFDTVAIAKGTLPPKGGFLLQDVTKGGFASVSAGQVAKGVRVDVTESLRQGATHYDVTITAATPGDHVLTLLYAEKLAEGPMTWYAGPDLSEQLTVESGERISGEGVKCGVGLLSKWPIGAASGGEKGVALGLDPEAPAIFRTGANPFLRGAYIAFDIAVTPEQPVAHFAFVRYPFAAAEGFRGAWAQYGQVFPEVFKVRAPKQGVWMAFRNISLVPNPEDFGFAFKEGDGETAWDDAHGYYTFRYTEPTTWWMAIGGKDGRKSATFEECLTQAKALARKGNAMARGWVASAMKDEDGRPYGRIMDTPWCNGIVWNANSAPGIPGGDFTVKNGEPAFSARFKGVFPQGLDGEYVDSAEMYVTDDFDFDRSHFRFMATPLTWTVHTHKPGIYKGLIGFEYVRAQAGKVHAKGRLMMANGVPSRWCWQIPYIDVTGTETDWNAHGKWNPDGVRSLLYRRAMCGGKPYCFLMNTDFSKFGYPETEKFMHRAIAFGMFPGFFSQSATSRKGAHYFDHPEYYNPVRPLFKKFVPLAKALSEAGWRPVNRLVKADNAKVVSEQFGAHYATVFNPTTKPLTVTFTAKGAAHELVANEMWNFDTGACTQTIPPETVRVLQFK